MSNRLLGKVSVPTEYGVTAMISSLCEIMFPTLPSPLPICGSLSVAFMVSLATGAVSFATVMPDLHASLTVGLRESLAEEEVRVGAEADANGGLAVELVVEAAGGEDPAVNLLPLAGSRGVSWHSV